MNRAVSRLLACVIVGSAVGMSPARAADDVRLPMPPQGKVDESLALIRDAYEADYQAAKESGEPEQLIAQLNASAGQEADPIRKYALLVEAENVAASHDNYRKAVELLDARAELFRIDGLALKGDLLKRLAGPKVTADLDLCDQAMDTAREAMRSDRFGVASDAASLAVSIAKAVDREQKAAARKQRRTDGRNVVAPAPIGVELVKKATALQSQVTATEKSFGQYEAAAEKAKTTPDDPAVNAVIGSYLCFVRGDWKVGLPALAKSNLSEFASLAADEIKLAAASSPMDPQQAFSLAGKWWSAAESKGVSDEREAAIKDHAAGFYAAIVDRLEGALEKKLAGSRLRGLAPPQTTATQPAAAEAPAAAPSGVVAAEPVRPQTMPSSAVFFQGRWLWFSDRPATPVEAGLKATELGGVVATVRSGTENEFFRSRMLGPTLLGIERAGERWVTQRGTPQEFFNWGHNQPNNKPGIRQTACVMVENGRWHDKATDGKYHFVVEVPEAGEAASTTASMRAAQDTGDAKNNQPPAVKQDTNLIRMLTVEKARELSQRKGGLGLNGLTNLSDEAANALAHYQGWLTLNGLTSLSDAAAAALGTVDGNLELNRLAAISDDAASALGQSPGILQLNGLTTLTARAAEGLSHHRFNNYLYLNGLRNISVDAAQSLSRHGGPIMLQGLTSLSPEVAQALSQHKNVLHLGGLTSLSPEAAAALAKHEGALHLQGLRTLSPEAAKALAKHQPPASASTLREHERGVHLNGLTVLADQAAQELRKNPDVHLPEKFRP